MKYKVKETRTTEFVFLVDAESEEEALDQYWSGDIEPTETIDLDPEVDIFFLEEVK